MNTLSLLDQEFKTTDENILKEFQMYPFELDDFQKHSIEKTMKGENVLVTASTGCGKTICAEMALIQAFKKGKKTIYTSPIKSLSNQKFYEFKKKFKDISFAIMTGDVKFNANEADVIIMTTEILRNLLYKKQYDDSKIEYKLDLNIDLKKDVGCVIFDECHYLNDKSRGKVWEECFVLLPNHINLVLLSATMNNASEIALWLQKIKETPCHLIPKKERIIPLNHYIFYTSKYPKQVKDQDFIKLHNKNSNKLVHILDNNRNFNELNYQKIKKLKDQDYKYYNSYNNNIVVIQKLVHLLKKKNLLPCLFFVFSRKKCLTLAKCIEQSLITSQEITEIKKIINWNIHKLDYPKMYSESPEFQEIEKLLYKGIAIHHSGLRPVFKEIIEILYSKGLIKVLFATETFAIGVNMPTKTVIFTSLQKYSDSGFRYLNTSEYLQMSGRAGRRGIDKIGTVILMANLFNLPDPTPLKDTMCGNSNNIISKFDLSYKFILKILLNDEYDFNNFLQKTLMFKQNNNDSERIKGRYNEGNEYLEKLPKLKRTNEEYEKYYNLKNKNQQNTKKENKYLKKKETEEFQEDYKNYLEQYEVNNELKYLKESIENIDYNNVVYQSLNKVMKFLEKNNYIEEVLMKDITKDNVKMKGIIASQINECNEILLTELLVNNYFDDLDEAEICGVLSLFSNTSCLNDDMKVRDVSVLDIEDKLKNKIKKIEKLNEELSKDEEILQIYINTKWDLNLDMIEYCYKWCKGYKYQDLYFDNYSGNFIKDILKLDNLICTLEVLCTILEKYDLYNKLNGIHSKILRDIVNNESLYIKL
jgi:superfamily II RNA helicase